MKNSLPMLLLLVCTGCSLAASSKTASPTEKPSSAVANSKYKSLIGQVYGGDARTGDRRVAIGKWTFLHAAGWLIDEAYGPEAHGRGVTQLEDGDQEILLFEKTVSYRNRHPIDQIIDVLELPKMELGEGIESQCYDHGKPDPEIFAMVVREDKEVYSNIKYAWKADRKTGKFQPIATRGITCDNRGWGV